MTDTMGVLSAGQREADIDAARSELFDVVVIGGGITGAGAALDAVSRGLRVLLVEADDFASGTSSRSSKLIHGGLRYLEMLDFGLVREALTERKLLLTRLAPHLVKPVNFIWPLTHRIWERAYLGAGLALYDIIGGAGGVPMHRHLSHSKVLTIAPGLDPNAYTGGLHFYDAIDDDARMTMMVVRTAKARGARVVSRTKALAIDSRSGRVTGLTVRDELTGESFPVRTRHIASAAGPWTSEIRSMISAAGAPMKVRPAKGIHIVVPRNRLQSGAGVLMRTEKSVLFVIPWGRYWLIGDTDTDWAEPVGSVVAHGGDVDYLLEKVNSIVAIPLVRDDIVGVFAGLRPLVQNTETESTAKLSREHTVTTPLPGLSLVAGGKYTTYRVMAKDLIDVVAADLGESQRRSVTRDLPLMGADRYRQTKEALSALEMAPGFDRATLAHLLGRYGDRLPDILDLIGDRPELAEPLSDEGPYLAAEVVYACSHEGALTIADILERRTRIGVQYADSGLSLLETVSALAADTLGWSARTTACMVSDYQRSVAAGDAALLTTTDAAAVAAFRAGLEAP